MGQFCKNVLCSPSLHTVEQEIFMTGKFGGIEGQAISQQENFVNLGVEDILSFQMSSCFATEKFRESTKIRENFLCTKSSCFTVIIMQLSKK